MNNLEKIRKLITEYAWDAKINQLNCNHFANQIEVCHDDGKDDRLDIVYSFINCYKVVFEHIKFFDTDLKKNGEIIKTKELNVGQIPCHLQEIHVSTTTENNINFYTCKIDMFPMNVEIWCKDIEVFKRDKCDKEK